MSNVMFLTGPILSDPRVQTFANGGSVISFLVPATGTAQSSAGEKLTVSVTIPSYQVARWVGVIEKGMTFTGLVSMAWNGMRESNDPTKYGPTWNGTPLEFNVFEGKPLYGNSKEQQASIEVEAPDNEF